MLKKTITVALCFCFILAVVAGVGKYTDSAWFEWFYTRLYFGNRVEGTYEVTTV